MGEPTKLNLINQLVIVAKSGGLGRECLSSKIKWFVLLLKFHVLGFSLIFIFMKQKLRLKKFLFFFKLKTLKLAFICPSTLADGLN